MPQTLIAFELNDEGEIPAKNGGPVRLRLETSTGFRSLKWLDRIEVVNRYDIILEGPRWLLRGHRLLRPQPADLTVREKKEAPPVIMLKKSMTLKKNTSKYPSRARYLHCRAPQTGAQHL